MIGRDKSRSVLVWLVILVAVLLTVEACRTVLFDRSPVRVVPSNTACEKIRDHDRRMFCRALSTKNPTWCEFIKNNDLRNECRARVGLPATGVNCS